MGGALVRALSRGWNVVAFPSLLAGVKRPTSRVVLAPSVFACWQPSAHMAGGLRWRRTIEDYLYRGDHERVRHRDCH